jgi:hypothetical protein
MNAREFATFAPSKWGRAVEFHYRQTQRRCMEHRRGDAYTDNVIVDLEGVPPGGRNNALNHAAWTLARWIAAGALKQSDIEDALYSAAVRNGLLADDGQRQCWATIRSGLSAGSAAAQRPGC